MRIELNGKTLWHVQANIDWHDDTYDIYILSEHEPTPEQYGKLYAEECDLEIDDQEVQDFIDNAGVYEVYATEL